MRTLSSQCMASAWSGALHPRTKSHLFDVAVDVSATKQVKERGGDAGNIPPRDRNLKAKEASMPKDLPSPELLRKLLQYEPETGKLFWRERPVEMFYDAKNPEQICASWNGRHAGKPALDHHQKSGYLAGSVAGVSVRAHRVAFAVYFGTWPCGQVDHIDHNRSNNRIENLRDVSSAQNAKNRALSPRNTTGKTGVVFSQKMQKFLAYVCLRGKTKYLGCFESLADAARARDEENKKHGFHDNHGRTRL